MPAGRGAILALLCLTAAILPGVAPAPPRPIALAAAPQTMPIGSEASTPRFTSPTPGPIPTVSPGARSQLAIGELTNKVAPIPPGPATYVPILLYHYIRINPVPADRVGFNLSTQPAVFRAQMQYLANHSFHVLSLHEAVRAIASHAPLPSHPVVLTFDDGYADFFNTAVPAMRLHGFTATDFVITGRMGVNGFMSTSQAVAADQMGFTIGAHTVDHFALAALPSARATWEMRQSRLTLETLLGHPVLDFAYPYGSYNNYDASEARRLGFECAVSTLNGTVHTSGQLMFLSRVRIGGAISLNTYAHLVGGSPPTPTELSAAAASASPLPELAPTPTPARTPLPSPLQLPHATPSPRPPWFL